MNSSRSGERKEKLTISGYLNQISSASQEDAQAIEAALFRRIWTANHTAKTTTVNRLDDVCSEISESLTNQSFEGCLELLDVGMSSGISTLEWHNILESDGIDHQITGIDICIDSTLLSLLSQFHALVDSKGRPMVFEVFGRIIENYNGESIVSRLKRMPILALLKAFFFIVRPIIRETGKIRLLSQEIQKEPGIAVHELDMLDVADLGVRYHGIRVANILNRRYFTDEFLRNAVDKLGAVLLENGILVIVRTDEDTFVNNGTIYRKIGQDLRPEVTIGSGSELEALLHPK